MDCVIKCLLLTSGHIEHNLSVEKTIELIWAHTPKEIARLFNCSENGFRKFCKRKGIVLPPKAYWIRRKCGHSHELALNPLPKRSKQILKRFNREQYQTIKALIQEGNLSLRAIGRQFGVDHKTIMGIRDNKTYKEFN